jgi:hypothetical protein
MTTLTNPLNEQLFQELDDKVAQNCNGGYREVFTIWNQTRANITYNLDRRLWRHLPREGWRYTTYRGGIILFDRDVRAGVESYKRYNLANGEVYAFRYDRSTPYNPYDIELYDVT